MTTPADADASLPLSVLTALDELLVAEVEYENDARQLQDVDDSMPEGKHLACLRKVRDEKRDALLHSLREMAADTARLDTLDNFCRRIALHAVGGTEPRSDYVFRWQIDHYGRGSPRPDIRAAIDAARTPQPETRP